MILHCDRCEVRGDCAPEGVCWCCGQSDMLSPPQRAPFVGPGAGVIHGQVRTTPAEPSARGADPLLPSGRSTPSSHAAAPVRTQPDATGKDGPPRGQHIPPGALLSPRAPWLSKWWPGRTP